MKLTISVLMLALVASASAQSTPATPADKNKNKPAATATKPAAANTKPMPPAPLAKSVTTVPAKTATPAQKPMVATKPAPVATKPAVVVVRQTPAKPVAPQAKTATHVVKTEKKSTVATTKHKTTTHKPSGTETASTKQPSSTGKAISRSGKRDPFQTVIVESTGVGPACTGGGKFCLVPEQVALRGVVRSNNGMIAVVTNSENRAYFLRENDPVFNGSVIKITPNSISFKQNGTDVFGKPTTREVVKKINPSAA